jgi:tRNA-Thr(GGU) m(6)t(6)A37 methyltransferase TsaA
MSITYEPIGIVHSPFREPKGMPIQPTGAAEVKGTIELFAEYEKGLKDLDGFSHLILLYHFHKSITYHLHVVPFMDDKPRGVFATRAPKRPNPIGLSVVRLKRVKGRRLHIMGVDMLDQTPVLDIKPYVPEFDLRGEIKAGWLEKIRKKVVGQRADKRFS